MSNQLLDELRPRAVGDGRYRFQLSDDWSFRGPSGGVLTSVALAAARAEVNDARLVVRSAMTIFCSRILPGDIFAQVEVLRRGNVAAQVRTRISGAGATDVGAEVSATFALEREGVSLDGEPHHGLPPPSAELPDALQVPFDRARIPTFFERLEGRIAFGHRWHEETFAAGVARFARWLRYRERPLTESGAFDRLALPPMVDTMPSALVEGLGSDFPRFVAPSLDLTVHFIAAPTPETEWLLVDSRCRSAADGYGYADVRVWDQTDRLLAFGAQSMIIRRPTLKP